ncbi:hypothetical protein SAMN05660971_01616 [Halomonas cupida]|uniref:Uncharacterized protein n=1 Tax=Halomonas cupida TaxID=44933 RepID=A0A1M7E5C1_9GAMM|nr:hypothetical protein SAMN05660971_01616 [Halomonas cupida]
MSREQFGGGIESELSTLLPAPLLKSGPVQLGARGFWLVTSWPQQHLDRVRGVGQFKALMEVFQRQAVSDDAF